MKLPPPKPAVEKSHLGAARKSKERPKGELSAALGKRNTALLSFGDPDGEDEEE